MAPTPRKPSTVLVVEDDPPLRTFYRSALLIAGYNVITASDGIEALQQIEGSVPDLIVLDIDLPRLDGRDVLAELKFHADTRDIPVLIVSGEDTSDLNTADFACALSKPVTADQFLDAVRDCLAHAWLHRDRRGAIRCPTCATKTVTPVTTINGNVVSRAWRCSGCEGVWPERRGPSATS